MLSLSTIITGLKLMGIHKLRIKFDAERNQIEAAFVYHGEPYHKIITFHEIEDAFQDAQE